MKKNPDVLIQHILVACHDITGYILGIDRERFFKDRKTQDAVIRQLAIIGEAAKSIPASQRARIALLPWYKMIGMRNILIHEYFGVDVENIWRTVQDDVPVLMRVVESYLKKSR